MKCATEILVRTVLFGLLAGLPSVALSAEDGLANPFFVLSNGVADDAHATPESQAKMLAELGCQGIGPSGSAGVAEMLAALDKHDLEMHALYIGVSLDADKPPYEAGLKGAIAALKGRKTIVWLYILSRQYKSPSAEGDPRAVEIIREIAQMAQLSGLRVALYPHAGFYVETVEDAVRVARKVDRKNVGVCFNLCHWLKVGSDYEMKPLMELALPHLFLVTINGADSNPALDKGWDRLIQPLGQGSFDVHGFVKTLHDLGFKGPVGLQCYGVKGDKYENLKQSIAAWREISTRITAAR